MIIVEIGRGLGNSMYVYAAGKALAEHHNTELKLDLSHIKSWPKIEKFGGEWEFELGKFNISAKEATNKELRKFVIKTKFRPLDKLIRKYKLFERRVYYFPTSGKVKDFFKLPNNIYLWGYFGHEKFFKPIKKIIREEFTLKEKYKEKINPLLNKISKENSVGIHVRRGDLLKIGALVLPLDYYKKAISIIKKKTKKPIFYIFSDDLEWCKKNFISLGEKFNFIRGTKSWEDFELMRNCKHNILANSALSWWAGYLNKNPKKIVISPYPFTQWISNDYFDNVPKGWKKIKVIKNE
ncbi:MAG: alpha-1,2-fucosyltransferase [Candidatus Parcubacteria bacterium]|nr:MAG: alpha-1,2-fucosyltransferase [Candidatus Pacearchaeota archaeon]GIW65354.1 MAG: alpha-1,2-fucosyltransferase [Candidatus Parcubacteria bacterium]